MPVLTIADVVAAFLAWKARHRAAKTAEFYTARLRLFRAEFSSRPTHPPTPEEVAAWRAAHPDPVGGDPPAEKPPQPLTSLELEAWLDMSGRGMSATTRRGNAVALSGLQAFALRQKLIPEPWFERIEKPRGGKRKRIPTPDELQRLLAPASASFRRLVSALCQCGARPGELCGLSIDQVHWDEALCILLEHKTARVTGEPREIAIGAAFGATLREAIGDRTAGPVFLSPRGKRWIVDSFDTAWRRLRQKAGLPRDLVPYHCRHRFATTLVQKGKPLPVIQKLMGHKSITTTQGYIHLNTADHASDQDAIPPIPPPETDVPPNPKAA